MSVGPHDPLLRRGTPTTTRPPPSSSHVTGGKEGDDANGTRSPATILPIPPYKYLLIVVLLVLVHIPAAGGYDLGLFEPPTLGERKPGLQLALYKYYTPLLSVPDLGARPPDLITWLSQVNQPGRYGTWPEAYAMNATPPQGFERYDGRTYSTRWAARITGQLLVDKANTFTFDLENREGAKLWVDGRVAVANDFNAAAVPGTRRARSHVHLTAGLHHVRVDFFVDNTWSALILRYGAPGFSRRVIPPSHFFMPDTSCCLCHCRGGQCRVADYGTGAVDCLWPSDDVGSRFNRPLRRGPIAAPERDEYMRRTCEHPCEDPGAAASIDDRAESVHSNYNGFR